MSEGGGRAGRQARQFVMVTFPSQYTLLGFPSCRAGGFAPLTLARHTWWSPFHCSTAVAQ